MSDTTTPASVVVAEIIGWTETTEVDVIGLRGWHRPGCVGYDPGVCECMGKPTPDDMLAFLRERRPDVAIEMWYDPEQDQPYWVRWWDGETPEQGGPTLHAALEAAVTAVGRAG